MAPRAAPLPFPAAAAAGVLSRTRDPRDPRLRALSVGGRARSLLSGPPSRVRPARGGRSRILDRISLSDELGEWAASYLWAFGKKVEETCCLCPETTRILGSIPGVAEFGTTMYSGLAPHTQIAPHFGYSNAKLRCQLPLRVPGRCKLKVGEHEIEQREGRCIIFDDSFLHSAWNDSDEPRFVLVFDFFHPDLLPDEVRYLSHLASERQLAKDLLDQAAAGGRVGWASPEARSGEEAAVGPAR